MSESADRRRPNHAVWIGSILSVVALVSYFFFFARFPALRDTPWVNLLVLVAGVGMSVFGYVHRRSLWSGIGLGLSIACATALIGYVYVLSYQLPDQDEVIAVGETAPGFEIPDQNGRTVRLADFRGSQVILVFYRGFW